MGIGVTAACALSLVPGDIGRVSVLCAISAFFFAAMCTTLLLSAFDANPPRYFRLLWLVYSVAGMIVMAFLR